MTGHTVLGVQGGLEAMYGISEGVCTLICTDLILLKGQLIPLATIFAIHHPQHSFSPLIVGKYFLIEHF